MASSFRDLLGGRSSAQRETPVGGQRGTMLSAAKAAESAFASQIDGLIDRLLDALFKHAESKLGSDDQRKALSAYSAVYENRVGFVKAIEKHLKARLGIAVDDFLNNRLTRPGVQTLPKTNELSLVETGETERQVVSGNVSARAAEECEALYNEMNARLATLAGLLEVHTPSNPFRPELVVVAIDEAWREIRPDNAPEMIVLERLGGGVLGDLSPIAKAVNNVLATGGYEETRPTMIVVGTGAPRAPIDTAQIDDDGSSPTATQTQPQRKVGVFKRIVEALSRQMVGTQPSQTLPRAGLTAPPAMPGAAMDDEASAAWIARQMVAAEAFARLVPAGVVAQPVGALSALQRAQIEQPTQFAEAMSVDPMVDDAGQPLGSNYMDPMSPVDVALRTPLRFVNVIRSIAGSEIGKRANQVDSMVIELVARLFDFVFEDDNLPDAIKVLLSRLQIPVLKAAMLDTEFFERENHPARRLVNSLANAGLGWEEQDGREDPLFVLIDRSVQRVLEEFEEDLSLFDRLADDVEAYVRQIEAETAAAARPEVEPARVEATSEEERLLAMRNARRAVEARLHEARTLPFVASFLRNAWADYLGELLVHHDDDETPLRNALDTADDLLWSVEPKRDPEDRRQLLIKIPYLDQQLRSGMVRVAMPAPDTVDFLSSLDERWAGAVIGEPIFVVEEVPEPTPEPEPDSSMQQILDLRPGAILEMMKDDGARFCYKLGWISEGKTRYLLTNRLNSAPLIVTAEHLAERLRAAKLRIIDRGPLMDRAMNSILTALEEVRYPEAQAML